MQSLESLFVQICGRHRPDLFRKRGGVSWMRCIDLDERPDPQWSNSLTPQLALLTEAVQVPGIADPSGVPCSDGVSVRNATNLHAQTWKSIDEWSRVFEPCAVNDGAWTVPSHPQYGMYSRDTQLPRFLDRSRRA
nr:hypothetical protein [Microbacterium chocolatum]